MLPNLAQGGQVVACAGLFHVLEKGSFQLRFSGQLVFCAFEEGLPLVLHFLQVFGNGFGNGWGDVASSLRPHRPERCGTAAGWAEGPSAWMRESMRGPWLPGGRCLKRFYGSSNAFAAAFGFWRGSALGLDALEQDAGRFVGRVLGHELAAEGLGQDALGQRIDASAGIGQASFELVGEGEEPFDAANNFRLLG